MNKPQSEWLGGVEGNASALAVLAPLMGDICVILRSEVKLFVEGVALFASVLAAAPATTTTNPQTFGGDVRLSGIARPNVGRRDTRHYYALQMYKGPLHVVFVYYDLYP